MIKKKQEKENKKRAITYWWSICVSTADGERSAAETSALSGHIDRPEFQAQERDGRAETAAALRARRAREERAIGRGWPSPETLS